MSYLSSQQVKKNYSEAMMVFSNPNFHAFEPELDYPIGKLGKGWSSD
jgi:hypothetical protein